jgi:hypothetical protein
MQDIPRAPHFESLSVTPVFEFAVLGRQFVVIGQSLNLINHGSDKNFMAKKHTPALPERGTLWLYIKT